MKNKKIVKIGTFFSGIGSPEKALTKLKDDGLIYDYKLEFFSEIDKNAIKSYCAVHNVDETLNLGNIKNIKGNDLPYCDLWIGGFPCQDISLAGKMKGFDFQNSTRSSLGWEMIRLLKEIKEKPKYIIFENVSNIVSERFINTLNLFKKDLVDLGYTLYEKVINSADFEIPQNRKRYFLVCILDNHKFFSFPDSLNQKVILKDFLDKTVDEKYYLTTNEYFKLTDNQVIFKNKKRDDIIYEINLEKLKKGGLCGKDNHCKFAMTGRVFSEYGLAPTLTANNTADNCKIVVESENY